jgi:hypothetical protein
VTPSSSEAVEVQAVFSPRALHPRPVSFRWHGREYSVEKVHLVYEAWEGDTRFLLYSLTAGGTFLELRYDMKRARWTADSGSREEG